MLAVALAAMVLLTAAPTQAHRGCHTRACVERVAAKFCGHGRPASCLHRAALRHRVSYRLLRSIAWCESRLRPWARNSASVGGEHASGLMQFLPSTFRRTRYGHRSIWSAKWNALAGAWLIRRVGTGPWLASRHCWG
jgi:hypothetical protein